MSHDHNFKNLILDYPHQAIGFFAAVEAQAVDAEAHILPIREGQLKEHLGERFRESGGQALGFRKISSKSPFVQA